MVDVTGGNKAMAFLRELARKFSGQPKVRVGFLEGSTYPDGTSVPLIAALNEFGVPSHNQPPRPFFRRMIADKQKSWGPAAGALLVSNNYDVDKVMNLIGEGIQGQLVQAINDLVSPPLAQSTIDAKGFDKPLIDTSVMVKSTGYEVIK